MQDRLTTEEHLGCGCVLGKKSIPFERVEQLTFGDDDDTGRTFNHVVKGVSVELFVDSSACGIDSLRAERDKSLACVDGINPGDAEAMRDLRDNADPDRLRLLIHGLQIKLAERDAEILKLRERLAPTEADCTKRDPRIKPCPFCLDATALNWQSNDAGAGVWCVFCQVCGAEGPHSDNEEKSIAKWNYRAEFYQIKSDNDLLSRACDLGSSINAKLRDERDKKRQLLQERYQQLAATKSALEKAINAALAASALSTCYRIGKRPTTEQLDAAVQGAKDLAEITKLEGK